MILKGRFDTLVVFCSYSFIAAAWGLIKFLRRHSLPRARDFLSDLPK